MTSRLHFVEDEPREPRIRLIAFDDIKLGIERRYLIKGLIPRVGLTVVWGPPKSGKTFWTFDAVMHVALNWSYRNRRVHHGPIIYCAFEGQDGAAARKAAFEQRFLPDDHEAVPFYLMPVTLKLVRDHQALTATIRTTLGDVMPVAVVLDTLNRSFTGSESSDEDMAAYVDAADSIRAAFECAIIIVHHCGVDGSRPRGHTSLTGGVAAQLAVTHDTANNVITTVEYMRDGPLGDTVASRLELVEVGTDTDGDALTSCVVLPVEALIKPAAKTKPGPKAAQIALRALVEALAEVGEDAPTSNHIPEKTKVTTFDRWRDYAYRLGISASDEPRARQQAFRRATEYLIAEGRVGVWDAFVWKAS